MCVPILVGYLICSSEQEVILALSRVVIVVVIVVAVNRLDWKETLVCLLQL